MFLFSNLVISTLYVTITKLGHVKDICIRKAIKDICIGKAIKDICIEHVNIYTYAKKLLYFGNKFLEIYRTWLRNL